MLSLSTMGNSALCNPYLRWDQQHPDLLHEIMTSVTSTQCWPCPYYGAKTHFPDNCPRSPFRDSTQRAKPPNRRESEPPICGDYYNGHCTQMHAHFNTSVCHARGPIHESPVQTGDRPLTVRPCLAMHTLHTL